MRTLRSATLSIALLVLAAPAMAQSVTGEASVTGGASSESVAAGAGQARVFGDVGWLTFYGELASAVSRGAESDAFGAAYPYEGGLHVMEAFGERLFRGERAIAGVRAGRFRTPFGIYGGSDHAYNGFLRAPLIRYPGYWALSNTFLEHGVNVLAGVPSLQVEFTAGAPADVGEERRRTGVDQVWRVQGYRGSLVVGVSRIRTQPYQPAEYAAGDAVFNGIDVRWMHRGLQVRGEWIDGRPFDGVYTRGGYLDVILHPRVMGPVTGVLRVETLDYDAGERSAAAQRATVGARVQLAGGLFAQVNAMHQTGVLYGGARNALDVAVTYTVRSGN